MGDSMSDKMNAETNTLPDVEACYEDLANQEEIYLEETEEEVRANLTLDDASARKTAVGYWRTKREELELGWAETASETPREHGGAS